MNISKVYQEPRLARLLLKMAAHFGLLGGTFRHRRPAITALTLAIEKGEFTAIRLSDGKQHRPSGKDCLKKASRFFNLGGQPPHQFRPSAIAMLRAIADGEIDLINAEGKRFWNEN